MSLISTGNKFKHLQSSNKQFGTLNQCYPVKPSYLILLSRSWCVICSTSSVHVIWWRPHTKQKEVSSTHRASAGTQSKPNRPFTLIVNRFPLIHINLAQMLPLTHTFGANCNRKSTCQFTLQGENSRPAIISGLRGSVKANSTTYFVNRYIL